MQNQFPDQIVKLYVYNSQNNTYDVWDTTANAIGSQQHAYPTSYIQPGAMPTNQPYVQDPNTYLVEQQPYVQMPQQNHSTISDSTSQDGYQTTNVTVIGETKQLDDIERSLGGLHKTTKVLQKQITSSQQEEGMIKNLQDQIKQKLQDENRALEQQLEQSKKNEEELQKIITELKGQTTDKKREKTVIMQEYKKPTTRNYYSQTSKTNKEHKDIYIQVTPSTGDRFSQTPPAPKESATNKSNYIDTEVQTENSDSVANASKKKKKPLNQPKAAKTIASKDSDGMFDSVCLERDKLYKKNAELKKIVKNTEELVETLKHQMDLMNNHDTTKKIAHLEEELKHFRSLCAPYQERPKSTLEIVNMFKDDPETQQNIKKIRRNAQVEYPNWQDCPKLFESFVINQVLNTFLCDKLKQTTQDLEELKDAVAVRANEEGVSLGEAEDEVDSLLERAIVEELDSMTAAECGMQ